MSRLRPDIWLLGLPLAASIWAGSVWRIVPGIESDLRRSVQGEVAHFGGVALARTGARIEVEGRDLTVVTDAPLGTEALGIAKQLPARIAGLRGPVLQVIPPASVRPYTFAVRRERDSVVLSGFVPPGPLRTELLDEARRGGASVRDEIRSATGMPPGFEEAARLLVRNAAKLEASSGSLTDREFTLAGVAPDSASYREVAAAAKLLPPGFRAGSVEVLPPLVRPFRWSATREGHRLVLAGFVPSEAERRSLLTFVREAVPDMTLDDRMDTARGLEPGIDFQAVARRAVAAARRLESGIAELNGRVLGVQGQLAARDLLASLQAELRTAKLPGVQLGRVELQPIVPRPYRLSARRGDGRIRLAGFVPGEAERDALRELVQRRFPVDAVEGELHLADGAPDGLLSAARLGIERLSGLAEGEAVIEDRRLRLAGRSLYLELARRVRAELARELPAGWSGAADVADTPQNPLDPDFCGDLVSDVVRAAPVRFEPGKAELDAAGRKTLGRVADIMRRCGTARLVVVSSVETAGDPGPARALAEQRAGEIVKALAERGLTALPRAAVSTIADPSRASEQIAFEVIP